MALVALSLAAPTAVRAWWPGLVSPDVLIGLYCGIVLAAASMLLAGLLRSTGLGADAVIELSDGTPEETLVQLRQTAAASGDPAARAALESAATLLASNAALHQDLAGKVAEVRASRDRLVEAAAIEQRRLERLLREGAVAYLAELAGVLRDLRDGADGAARELAGQCLDEVDRTRDDLDQLARGLHPRTLAERGLAAALAELAERSPVPTTARAPRDRLPAAVEAALWYACAEALANVAKHARASAVSVEVRAGSGEAVATIRDDGRGGARVIPAGGLAGLVDRLAGAGGQLAVGPAEGGGTAVQVRIPLP
jgi:signal transduction histidine kinase